MMPRKHENTAPSESITWARCVFFLLTAFVGQLVHAQLLPGDTGTLGAPTFEYTSGPNFTQLIRTNFTELGTPFHHGLDHNWWGMDDDEEPIDEIVVTARRRLSSLMDLYLLFDIGNIFSGDRCLHWTDGGYCQSTIPVYNEDFPLDPACQTHNATMGPLSGSQVNQLDLEHQQTKAIGSGAAAISVSVIAAYVTSRTSLVTQLVTTGGVGLGTIAATNPSSGDFPFTAGDVVNLTISAFNAEGGGVTGSVSMTIQ